MTDQRNDPQLVFFFGAGASVKADVPTTFQFVDDFLKSIDEIRDIGVKPIVEGALKFISDWRKEKGDPQHSRIDIEQLMEVLDRIRYPTEDPFIRNADNLEKYGLDDGFARVAFEKLKDFIKKKSVVPPEKISYLEPLSGFIQDYRPLDIFSVNYDICVELFCHAYKKSYREGFDVEWNPAVFDNKEVDIRLFKIHGSVTWYQSTSGAFFRSVIDLGKADVKLLTGEKAEPVMLYPMRKWEYVEPLLENLITLKRRLESPECKYAVVVGYSFRDDQIVRIFFDAARRNRDLRLVLVDPEASTIYRSVLARYGKSILESVPSSLAGKVLCLPYKFEDILPSLKNVHLRSMQRFVQLEKDFEKKVLNGEAVSWVDTLRSLLDAEYIDKLEEILKTRIPGWQQFEHLYDLLGKSSEGRFVDGRMDILLLMELYLKRGLYHLTGAFKHRAQHNFLNLVALLELVLVRRLHLSLLTINGVNYIEYQINRPQNYRISVLREKLQLFSTHIHATRFSHLTPEINAIYDLIDGIGMHLVGIDDNNRMTAVTYLAQYDVSYDAQIRQMKEIIGKGQSPALVNQFEQLAIEVERKEVMSIIGEAHVAIQGFVPRLPSTTPSG